MASIDHSQQQITIQHKDLSVTSEINHYRFPQAIINHLKAQCKSQRSEHPLVKPKHKTIISKAIDFLKFKRQKPRVIQNCLICQSEVPVQDMLSIGNCQHKFCQKCLSSYVTYKINIFEQVYCPNQNCTQILQTDTVIFKNLPRKLQQKYYKILQYQSTLLNSTLKICPNQHCQGILDLNQKNAQQNSIKCNKCQKTFCRKCWMNNHQGSCDKYQVLFFEVSLSYRQCKKCSRIIERTSGCDHMTCKCGYQFCILCGREWNSQHVCNATPQCCIETFCCRIFFKILYIILYTFIAYPIVIIKIIILLLMVIVTSVMVGILIEPIAILSQLCAISPCYMLLGVIFYPIVIIFAVARSIQKVLGQVYQTLFPYEQLCSVCIMIQQTIQTVSQKE